MRLGKQARDDGAFDSDNVLGDMVESLIGALWLDAGLEAAQRASSAPPGRDRVDSRDSAPQHPKSALQEWAAANDRRPPAYEVVGRSGPQHAPTLRRPGLDQGRRRGRGGGPRPSRKPRPRPRRRCWTSWHEPALRHRRRGRRAQCRQVDPGQRAGRPEGRDRHPQGADHPHPADGHRDRTARRRSCSPTRPASSSRSGGSTGRWSPPPGAARRTPI